MVKKPKKQCSDQGSHPVYRLYHIDYFLTSTIKTIYRCNTTYKSVTCLLRGFVTYLNA